MAGRKREESEICSGQCHPLLPVGRGNLGQPSSPWAFFCCMVMEGWPALLGEHSSLLFTMLVCCSPEQSSETCGGNRHPEGEAGVTEKMFSMQKWFTSVCSCLHHVVMGWLSLHHCPFNNTAQAALDPHNFGEEEEENTTQQLLQGPCTLAAKRGSICRASAVIQTHPWVHGCWAGFSYMDGIGSAGESAGWRSGCVSGGVCHGSACLIHRDATWGDQHWPQPCLGLCGMWWPQREVDAPGSAHCSWGASLVKPRVPSKGWAEGAIKSAEWQHRDNTGYEWSGQWAYPASHFSFIHSCGNSSGFVLWCFFTFILWPYVLDVFLDFLSILSPVFLVTLRIRHIFMPMKVSAKCNTLHLDLINCFSWKSQGFC